MVISENARNLISKILLLDCSKRPTLTQIMQDPFMSDPIPTTIPRSTLACPPAKNFTEQYAKQPVNPTGMGQKSGAGGFDKVSAKPSEKDLKGK